MRDICLSGIFCLESDIVEATRNLESNKTQARNQFVKQRESFAQSQKDLDSLRLKIAQRVQTLIEQIPPTSDSSTKTIASYKARDWEVFTCEKTFNPTHSPIVRWVYPRVKGSQLEFLEPKSFVKSSWGIDEPSSDSPLVPIHQIDIVLIPGIAFDRKGQRLGTGFGFYDKTLASFGGVKIGLAYSIQISNEDLPTEPHDLPMDYVVTENYTIKRLKRL